MRIGRCRGTRRPQGPSFARRLEQRRRASLSAKARRSLALGTDTGGSVRIPASVTGIGRPEDHQGSLVDRRRRAAQPDLRHAGLLARSAVDAAFAFEQLDGETVPRLADLAGIRLGPPKLSSGRALDPGVAERVDEALQLAEADGARKSRCGAAPAHPRCSRLYHRVGSWRPSSTAFSPPSCRTGSKRSIRACADAWMPARRCRLGSILRARTRYAAAGRRRRTVACWDRRAGLPDRADHAAAGRRCRGRRRLHRATCWRCAIPAASFLGLCAVTLPVGRDAAGMPVGLQLIGTPSEASAAARDRGAARAPAECQGTMEHSGKLTEFGVVEGGDILEVRNVTKQLGPDTDAFGYGEFERRNRARCPAHDICRSSCRRWH